MEKDDRFKHISTDPKFRRIPKAERKIKIDKRFQSMFSDDKFKVKYTIDKRGRPVNHTSTEDLKRYYELNSEDESDSSEEVEDEEELETETGKFVRPPKESEEIDELNKKDKNDKEIPKKIKKKLKNLNVDYARGEGVLVSESSSDDDSESEELSEAESVDHGWGELDKDAEKTDEITNRLAVCNQDWDRIRAVDLMVLFTSFVPSGGVIHSVTIYPSDFGLQRLKEEEVKGPIELVDAKKKHDDSDEDETEEGSKYHMEKLRQYQLNRLKYYYAVVVCDSPETANKIYTECDGLEYESSATKIDLRFIPDDTDFENEPKEVCENIPDKYQPRFFTTTALQQAKVELTWDETNPERLEVAKKLSSGNIDDVTDADLQAYLASSSGEESNEEQENGNNSDDENDDNPIDKYRALLQDIEKTEQEKDNKNVEMEITWGLNLKEKTEKLVKKKLAENEEKTPFQQFLDKRKEKKKEKREERKKKLKEAVKSESNSDNEDSDIPSDIDMNDPYFAEEFDKPEFKKKKSKNKTKENEDESKQNNAELELLLLNENEDSKKHFSLKKIQEQENTNSKKNRKKKKKAIEENGKHEDDFELDVKDDRFSALYSSHHFNIDPTDPHYKKTKGMEKLIEEKLKRRNTEDESGKVVKKPKTEEKKDIELSVLVKNIKRKTKDFGVKK